MTETKKQGWRKLRFLSRYLNVFCLLLTIGIFTALRPNFLNAYNIRSFLGDSAPLMLMSAGVTFVLLLGSIDLSTGTICSCACVFAGLYIGTLGNMMIPLVLFGGALAGLCNGLLFTKLKVPSFIVTLCTTEIWRFIALRRSGGVTASIHKDFWDIFAWTKLKPLGIPIYFLIAAGIVIILFYFIQNKTTIGKSIYAVGANEKAARMMGIRVDRVKIAAFVISGTAAAAAGILLALKQKASLPAVGNSMNLMAIAAVVLGGTSLSGGKGSVLKTLIGVLIVTIINNGMDFVGVDAFWKDIIFGATVIAAVYFNGDKQDKISAVK